MPCGLRVRRIKAQQGFRTNEEDERNHERLLFPGNVLRGARAVANTNAGAFRRFHKAFMHNSLNTHTTEQGFRAKRARRCTESSAGGLPRLLQYARQFTLVSCDHPLNQKRCHYFVVGLVCRWIAVQNLCCVQQFAHVYTAAECILCRFCWLDETDYNTAVLPAQAKHRDMPTQIVLVGYMIAESPNRPCGVYLLTAARASRR